MRAFAYRGSVRSGPSEDLDREQPSSSVTNLTRDAFLASRSSLDRLAVFLAVHCPGPVRYVFSGLVW